MLKDIHVDCALGNDVVNMELLLLAISAAARDGLGHCGVVVVLGFCEQGRDEDDVIGVGEISGIGQTGSGVN